MKPIELSTQITDAIRSTVNAILIPIKTIGQVAGASYAADFGIDTIIEEALKKLTIAIIEQASTKK